MHWDVWNLNIIVQNEQVTGLLDFQRALWADPLMEAQFRVLFFGQEITPSLRGYGKTSFTETEQQRNYSYSLYFVLVLNIEPYYRNYDDENILTWDESLSARRWSG